MPKPSAPRHPGSTVRVYLEALNPPLFQGQAAKKMGIPLNRLHELINGKRAVTVDTAVRLARLFTTTTPFFWLGLQNEYDVAHWRDTKKAVSA